MSDAAKLASAIEGGRLCANVVQFSHALRRAGLNVGTDRIIEAVRAIDVAGFSTRDDFRYALRACLTSRPEHQLVFEQIFRLFWRDPRYQDRMMAMLVPSVFGVNPAPTPGAANRRAAEALIGDETISRDSQDRPQETETETEIDSSLTWSAAERLRTMDFEQMSASEQSDALRMIKRIDLKVKPLSCRRSKESVSGWMTDRRATFRSAMRTGGELQRIVRRSHTKRWPDLVALCDISGSMSSYSRMLLHFLHLAGHDRDQKWGRVHSFTFGTRLTNITRQLSTRDPDIALAAVGRHARDWEGGTRIASCLREFNRDWGRRVLGKGAVVLLITDGLDQGDPEDLAHEAEKLRLSCREVIWINPLMRWDGFQPLARGARALLPQVHRLVSGHSVESLEKLADMLRDGTAHMVRDHASTWSQDRVA